MALPPVLLLLAFGLVVGSFLVSSRMSRNAAREAAAAPEQDPEVAQWLGEVRTDAVPRPRPERLSPFSASRSGSGPAS